MSIVSRRFSQVVVSGCFALFLLVASFSVFATPVDINTADADTLASELNGVGAAKAAAIVAYRESNGPFKQLEDLLQVKGVGKKILEKNRAILVIQKQN
ncbi:MAG: competence protein ComEA [Gammaproteobacteria bacterium]|nr:competence protein ComEA [Gammaproteobacteria bacterium]